MNCAWCDCYLRDGATTGESQVYSPTRSFVLCEPCWLEEDALVEESGTNDLPEQLAIYRGSEG